MARRTAFVAGASGTFGHAVARRLHGRGLCVALHAFEGTAAVDALTESLPGSFSVRADLRDWPQVVAVADEVHTRLDGSVGVLVNCAGARIDGLLAGQAPEEWRQVIDVNLLGAFHVCRAFLPRMLQARYGRIVNVVSPAGQRGSPGQTAYSASKAGVIGLSRSLAHECGGRGVTVNCVSPGFMETAMTSSVSVEARDMVLGLAAVGGAVPADEVAQVLDIVIDAPHLTGQVLAIDGGLSA